MLRSFALRASLPAALCLLLLSHAQRLAAQEPQPLTRPQYGIGYAANLPDMAAGGLAYVILPRWGGIGLYVDAKFDIETPADKLGWDGTVTGSQVADDPALEPAFVKDEYSSWSANVALMRPVSPYFTLYAGGGLVQLKGYQLYNVALGSPVGYGGVVWAEEPSLDETKVNFMVGMLTRLTSRITAHFGFETEPNGVTAGMSLRLPRW